MYDHHCEECKAMIRMVEGTLGYTDTACAWVTMWSFTFSANMFNVLQQILCESFLQLFVIHGPWECDLGGWFMESSGG